MLTVGVESKYDEIFQNIEEDEIFQNTEEDDVVSQENEDKQDIAKKNLS